MILFSATHPDGAVEDITVEKMLDIFKSNIEDGINLEASLLKNVFSRLSHLQKCVSELSNRIAALEAEAKLSKK